MPSVIEALRVAELRLVQFGVEQARACAEWLLSEVKGCCRSALYHRDIVITSYEDECYVESVEKLCEGTPFEYLTGYAQFDGLRLAVRPGVFIPRPETEVLVEAVRAELSLPSLQSYVGIDLGVGSGNIAISLTKSAPNCRILGVDCSRNALSVARENVVTHGVARQVSLIQADWRQLLATTDAAFDLIVSNPPYIASGEIPLLPAVVRSEPRQALDGGEDGLASIRVLVEHAGHSLNPGGLMACEIGMGQAPSVVALLAAAEAFDNVRVLQDLCGRDRVIVARRAGR